MTSSVVLGHPRRFIALERDIITRIHYQIQAIELREFRLARQPCTSMQSQSPVRICSSLFSFMCKIFIESYNIFLNEMLNQAYTTGRNGMLPYSLSSSRLFFVRASGAMRS